MLLCLLISSVVPSGFRGLVRFRGYLIKEFNVAVIMVAFSWLWWVDVGS